MIWFQDCSGNLKSESLLFGSTNVLQSCVSIRKCDWTLFHCRYQLFTSWPLPLLCEATLLLSAIPKPVPRTKNRRHKRQTTHACLFTELQYVTSSKGCPNWSTKMTVCKCLSWKTSRRMAVKVVIEQQGSTRPFLAFLFSSFSSSLFQ